MFGLMRAKNCGMSTDERRFRRLNYCGTCKTIGSRYSAKSRMVLNHDIVFLAEVLTALSGEDVTNWDKSYQSFNCLSLPKGSIPVSLEFAAAANIILTMFKVEDHVADCEGVGYGVAARVMSSDFSKAERYLLEQNFSLAEVKSLLDSQRAREQAADSIDDLAFPTAQTTGIVFREGARLIGRADVADAAFEVGFVFGKLIYLLDAFEDYQRDARRGQFNAIRTVYGIGEEQIPMATKNELLENFVQLELQLAENLRVLPISEGQKLLFVSRLGRNLERKVGPGLPVIQPDKVCSRHDRIAVGSRWRTAVEKARELTKSLSWQMPLVFIFVFVFTLVAPASHAREARSARECFDLSFNLMFLGSILGAAIMIPRSLMNELPPEAEETPEKGAKRGGSSGSWCGGCDCDCCSSCCDCCDCF